MHSLPEYGACSAVLQSHMPSILIFLDAPQLNSREVFISFNP